MKTTTFKVWQGNSDGGELKTYEVEVAQGYVVLDAIHRIQAEQANDLAVRWNCKAGKCGSCSAEVNGSPKLMCMTRVDELPADQPITVEPMRTFPVVKDLVTDVSWITEMEVGIWISMMSNVLRNSGNVLSVSCAKTYVTSSGTINFMTDSPGHATMFTWQIWR